MEVVYLVILEHKTNKITKQNKMNTGKCYLELILNIQVSIISEFIILVLS
jgi:hypothetical protein